MRLFKLALAVATAVGLALTATSAMAQARNDVPPQVLRFALPGLGNVWQLCLKESALVSVIGITVHFSSIDVFSLFTLLELRFNDLLRQANIAAGSTRQPFAFARAERRALLGMRRA